MHETPTSKDAIELDSPGADFSEESGYVPLEHDEARESSSGQPEDNSRREETNMQRVLRPEKTMWQVINEQSTRRADFLKNTPGAGEAVRKMCVALTNIALRHGLQPRDIRVEQTGSALLAPRRARIMVDVEW